MGSRLGVIIRSENGWELYYDLGGVGARPPLARPSRSGYRLSRRAAPSDVHLTAPNSSAPGTSSGPRSRASRSGSRNPLWRCGVEPPLMSYCAFPARNIPGLAGDRRDGARGFGTMRDGTVLARTASSSRPSFPVTSPVWLVLSAARTYLRARADLHGRSPGGARVGLGAVLSR